MPARRSPFRPPPLRGDRTRSGAAERQGAPAVARVDRVLQLVDPSARAAPAAAAARCPGRSCAPLAALPPHLEVQRRASSYFYRGFGHLAVAAAGAAAGHRGRPPRRRRLDGPRRQRGTRRSAGGSLLDRRAAAAAGLGRGGCANVTVCLRGPARWAEMPRSAAPSLGLWLDSISSKAPRRRWWRRRWSGLWR
jgi:hypothetical protein